MNQKFLGITFVIFAVFTITLTETLQLADGLSMSGNIFLYELEPGETQMIIWQVQNNHDIPYPIEFYAEGKGSEYLIFEKYIDANAHEIVLNEIYVQIPENHPTDVEYRVKLYALQLGQTPEGGASGAVINVQVLTEPIIRIGANPIYYAEDIEPPTVSKKIEEIPVDVDPQSTVPEEVEVEESFEDKLAKIKALNKAKEESTPEVSVTDTPEIKDNTYIEEPIVDPEPTQVDLPTCGFWEMVLSWFGIKSDCI